MIWWCVWSLKRRTRQFLNCTISLIACFAVLNFFRLRRIHLQITGLASYIQGIFYSHRFVLDNVVFWVIIMLTSIHSLINIATKITETTKNIGKNESRKFKSVISSGTLQSWIPPFSNWHAFLQSSKAGSIFYSPKIYEYINNYKQYISL